MRDELFDHLKHRLAETEVPDPGQGWQMMSRLLDATAPPRSVLPVRWWYAAAAACLIVGGASWAIIHQGRSGRQKPLAVSIASREGTMAGVMKPTTGDDASSTAPVGIPVRIPGSRFVVPHRSRPVSLLTAGNGENGSIRSIPVVAIDALPQISLIPAKSIADLFDPSGILIRKAQPMTSSLRPIVSALSPVAGPLHLTKHTHWGAEIGLGANLPGSMRTVTVNNKGRFEPGLYPVITVLYRLTGRLTLKTGVAAPSPVAYAKTLSQKNLDVNDSAYAYGGASVSTTQKIGRLLYLDVPLTVEWVVVPHLNLEGGLQLSHLLSRQEDVHTSVAASYNLVAYTPPVRITENNPSQIRQTDIRCVVGASYQWHRFSAGVQYQAGLQHATSQIDDQGNMINSHTSIAKMQLLYRLH